MAAAQLGGGAAAAAVAGDGGGGGGGGDSGSSRSRRRAAALADGGQRTLEVAGLLEVADIVSRREATGAAPPAQTADAAVGGARTEQLEEGLDEESLEGGGLKGGSTQLGVRLRRQTVDAIGEEDGMDAVGTWQLAGMLAQSSDPSDNIS
eukprot:COSAG01_NODE_7381_length_3230_cov_1.541999_3_plen_150_part_00